MASRSNVLPDLLRKNDERSAISMTSETSTIESGDDMKNYDFSALINVELINADLGSLTDEQLSVMYAQARYCQAMTDADIDTMRELVSEDMTYTFVYSNFHTKRRSPKFQSYNLTMNPIGLCNASEVYQ